MVDFASPSDAFADTHIYAPPVLTAGNIMYRTDCQYQWR
jgi:hypothetical protein